MSNHSRHTEEKSRGSILFDWVKTFVFVIVVVVLVFTFLRRIVFVDGSSMVPTLSDRDGMLVTSYLFSEPSPGDVVVFRKDAYNDKEPLVKRVIATEGQTVDIDFEKGVVYVDGEALDEPYIKEPTHVYYDVLFPITVERGCIFVLGDNRNGSTDSRYSVIGAVDTREVIGRVRLVIFPFSHFGGVD